MGGALLAHAAGRARAHQREMLLVEVAEAGPGEAFARAKGMREVASQARQSARPVPFRPAGAEDPRLPAGVPARPHPQPLITEMITFLETMNDAPLDDLAVNEEFWTTADVEAMEEAWDLTGQDVFTVVARADDGTAAAFTRLFADKAEPGGWARQTDTAVVRAHRGRGLGQWVKEANTAWLKRSRPDLARVITWNAVANGPMVAINERLGYEFLDVWHEWELRV